MADDLFVRLVPVAPRLGYHVRGHMYKGIRFVGGERPDWYQVTREFAFELSQLLQDPADPNSKPLFQVYDGASKELVERSDNERYLAMLGAVTATVSVPKEMQNPSTMAIRDGEASLVAAGGIPVAKPKGPSIMPMSMTDIANANALEASEPVPDGRAAALPPTRQPAREATPAASYTPPAPLAPQPPPPSVIAMPPPSAMLPPPGGPVLASEVRPRAGNDDQDE